MRAEIKETRELARSGKMDEAKGKISAVYKAIDKAARRGVIKKNTASRKKSRIARLINVKA